MDPHSEEIRLQRRMKAALVVQRNVWMSQFMQSMQSLPKGEPPPDIILEALQASELFTSMMMNTPDLLPSNVFDNSPTPQEVIKRLIQAAKGQKRARH